MKIKKKISDWLLFASIVFVVAGLVCTAAHETIVILKPAIFSEIVSEVLRGLLQLGTIATNAGAILSLLASRYLLDQILESLSDDTG